MEKVPKTAWNKEKVPNTARNTEKNLKIESEKNFTKKPKKGKKVEK